MSGFNDIHLRFMLLYLTMHGRTHYCTQCLNYKPSFQLALWPIHNTRLIFVKYLNHKACSKTIWWRRFQKRGSQSTPSWRLKASPTPSTSKLNVHYFALSGSFTHDHAFIHSCTPFHHCYTWEAQFYHWNRVFQHLARLVGRRSSGAQYWFVSQFISIIK